MVYSPWFLRFYLGRRVANRNRVSTHFLECVCVCLPDQLCGSGSPTRILGNAKRS